MTPYQIIKKKRDGGELSREEMEYFLGGYLRGEISDYQISAFLMTVYFQGMSKDETYHFTHLMLESGEKIDLSSIPGIKADKHSTGGVADTVTLILAPLVASAGVPMAKLTGRGLGHTGGTLDKLESIPGFRTDLSLPEFLQQVKDIGLAVAAQTQNLVPADKKLYAIRDVTATVDSIPLICGSVMSKKLASGADAILLDVKIGSGAFMKTEQQAEELAGLMVEVGKLAEKKVCAVISDMNQPLGSCIGNALEVKEAIEILNGLHKDSALRKLSVTLAGYLLQMGGKSHSPEEGVKLAEKQIECGQAREKMREMIKRQGGNDKVIDDLNLLPWAKFISEVNAHQGGYLTGINTEEVGNAALLLGAGRLQKDDIIDPSVGIILAKRLGEQVLEGELLAHIFSNSQEKAHEAGEKLLSALTFSPHPGEPPLLIHKIIY